jgi:peptidoglycan/LPS O-acetylase OafA/YrhL
MGQKETAGPLARLLRRLEHRTGIGEVMPGLDGVRALAIGLVFGFHLQAFAGQPDVWVAWLPLTPWLRGGDHGVDLFFALSGFLLMLAWAKAFYRREPPPSALRFYRRRVLRIVPAYYLHLAVLFGVLVPVVHSWRYLASPEGYLNAVAHPLFAQLFFPSTATGMGVNGVLWTLGIEAQFYLILPWVARFFLGKRVWLALAGALVITEAWIYLSQHQLLGLALEVASRTDPTYYDPITATPSAFPPFLMELFLLSQFPGKLFHFAVGMALAVLYARHHYRGGAGPGMDGGFGALVTAACLGLFLALVAYAPGGETAPGLWNRQQPLAMALASGLVVWSAGYCNGFSRRVLAMPAVRIVGVISYSLYLWHVPICFFVQRDLVVPGVHGIGVFWYLAVVCGVLSLGVAYLSYRYVERPFLSSSSFPNKTGAPSLSWLRP